jgi:stringent starvation protein B
MIQQVADAAANSENDPLGAATGAFFDVALPNGPIDFKNNFAGQPSDVNLPDAGNFAYYAIGSGTLPNFELDLGAIAYGVATAVFGNRPFSDLTGNGSDKSAAKVRDAALASDGCKK